VFLYGDVLTGSMRRAMEITRYRRAFQERYNRLHGITPKTIVKAVAEAEGRELGVRYMVRSDVEKRMIELDSEMRAAAERLEFERAIELRNAVEQMRRELAKKTRREGKDEG
jgi:excinuclease ABC subunit B